MSNPSCDSNATKLRELCEMLDERGIEWTKGDASYEIEWTNPNGQHCSAIWWKPTLTVLMSGCTPEQAIAATLGSEREKALEELLDRWHSFAIGNGLDQSCADYEEWCALERATLDQLGR